MAKYRKIVGNTVPKILKKSSSRQIIIYLTMYVFMICPIGDILLANITKSSACAMSGT